MRCKNHSTDLSSTLGVCASCLRERLVALMDAQAQEYQLAQLEQQAHPRASEAESHRESDAEPPPLLFPCSVSPYVTRRKSEHSSATDWDNQFDLRFYSTPQVGTNYDTVNGVTNSIATSRSFSKLCRFRLLSRLFRSRSENPHTVTDRNSSSWLANIFSARRNEKSSFAMEDASGTGCRRRRRMAHGEMSSVGGLETDCDDSDRCLSGGADSEESSRVRRNPAGGPSAARRGTPAHCRNVSTGFVFCLSPLVRASPSRQWKQKGVLPPDFGYPADARIPVNPHIASAAAYCANRSRKFADFGRVNHNR